MEENNNNLIVELDKAKEDTLYDETDSLSTTDVLEGSKELYPPLEATAVIDRPNNDKIDELKVPKKQKKPKKVKSKKPKKEFFWKRLSKKGKIITIVCASLALLLIIGLLLYFLVFKNHKKEEPKKEVILKKSSYVYENGKLKFLDGEKKLGIYECKNKDPKKCFIAKFVNEDEFDLPKYVDEKGKKIDRESKVYAKKYVFITDGNELIFYNLKKNKKIDNFELIKNGDNEKDLVVVKNKEGKYALYSFSDSKYEKLIDFKFDNIGLVSLDDRVIVKEGDIYFIADTSGSPLSNKLSFVGKIKNFDNNFIALLEEGKYVLYDYQGKEVFKTHYEFMNFENGYVFAINEGSLYVYDKSGEKLNEAPIKLKTTNYQTKYVFDSKNNLKETKKPYKVTYSTGQVVIEVTDSKNKPVTRTINLYEVALNKNMPNFKYLDGFIYIFDDAEKENLVGTYACTNKNVVTSSTTSFNNCVLAKDTNIINKVDPLGYTPIYNNNYAFIYDTKDGSNSSNIVLYEFSTEKIKVRYQAVDTGKSTASPSFVTGNDDLIYAKNTDGEYGIIKITDGGPSKVIKFEGVTKIETFANDQLLVTRGSSEEIYDKTGKMLAKSSFHIIEFTNNYLVVKDKGYLIYKMANPESGTILTDEFDYLKLYPTYIVGIKNRKLNVYNLNNAKKPLIEEDLAVVNSKLESSYRLNATNNGYTIDILKADGTISDTYKFKKDWSKSE